MKVNTLVCWLAAAVLPTIAAPTNEQAVLGGHDFRRIDQTKVFTVTHTTAITTTITKAATQTTPTPQASISPARALEKHFPEQVWDWLFHPTPRNRRIKPEPTGCFCGGGSVCCYSSTRQLSCGYGACGL